MGGELMVADEFSRWFEWLAAADPEAAREVQRAVDEYAEEPDLQDDLTFDVCVAPSPRGLAFVAAHVQGSVLIATGAEVGESVRRCMTLLRRGEKVVRNVQRGKVALRPWSEVRRWVG